MSKDRVLVVDDDDALRSLLALICRRSGFEVDQASNGGAALDAIARNEYMVAILDLQMPNLNGFDVIEKLAARPRRPFILVMTALPASALTGLNAAVVQAIIRKPFDAELLGGLLSELAKLSPSRHERRAAADGDSANAPS
jgi:DNA-binding response OmpR family regulator